MPPTSHVDLGVSYARSGAGKKGRQMPAKQCCASTAHAPRIDLQRSAGGEALQGWCGSEAETQPQFKGAAWLWCIGAQERRGVADFLIGEVFTA